jgi:hypothetical protein
MAETATRGGVITLERELLRELLRTLKANELALVYRDTAGASLVVVGGSQRYAPLTLETIRAREWLEDQLADGGIV